MPPRATTVLGWQGGIIFNEQEAGVEALGPSQELAAPLLPWLSGEHSGEPFSSDALCPDSLRTSALVGEV